MYQIPNFNEMTNLVELARWQAQHNPDKTVITYLANGDAELFNLSFRELDERARTLASWLQTQFECGDRALLVFPPGLDFVIGLYGCIYAGITAVLVTPPRPGASLEPMLAVASQSQARGILTTSAFLAGIKPIIDETQTSSLTWLATDQIPPSINLDNWKFPPITPDTLTLLVYTSGSTSTPKGAMLSHHNYMGEIAAVKDGVNFTEDTVFFSWAPPYHIAGMFWLILLLNTGMRFIWMTTQGFLEQPARWLRQMTRYQCTSTLSFNFGLLACIERLTPEEKNSIDLSHMNSFLVGGEQIKPDLLEKFASNFAQAGFRREAFIPCYALTEATACGSVTRSGFNIYQLSRAALEQNKVVRVGPEDEEGKTYVGCGLPLANKKVSIVNPETRLPCRGDQVGEIWISGPSVSLGYWNRPEETQYSFKAYLADGTGPYFRTGDQGFMVENDLIITGRLKEMVIIHGKNFYSQDFEKTAEGCHPLIISDGIAAFGIPVGGEERLAVAVEVKPDSQEDIFAEIIRTVRQKIGQVQQQSVYLVALVKAGSLPRTPTGKLQRFKIKDRLLSDQLGAIKIDRLAFKKVDEGGARSNYVAPRRPIERALVGIWSSIMGINRIGVNDNFFELGGDSLIAAQILSQVQDVFQVKLSSPVLYNCPTIAAMADMIDQLRGNRL